MGFSFCLEQQTEHQGSAAEKRGVEKETDDLDRVWWPRPGRRLCARAVGDHNRAWELGKRVATRNETSRQYAIDCDGRIVKVVMLSVESNYI